MSAANSRQANISFHRATKYEVFTGDGGGWAGDVVFCGNTIHFSDDCVIILIDL